MQIGVSSPRRTLEPLCDKIGRDTVERVIHVFYDRLRADPALRSYFSGMPDFAGHEAHIADFWWVAMGGRLAEPRQYDMRGRHRALGLDATAFERWLQLFGETLATHLPPALAEQWLQMAYAISANLKRHML